MTIAVAALWEIPSFMAFARVRTSVRHSDKLRRVSKDAQLAYWRSLTLAEDCACEVGVRDRVGALEKASTGAMNDEDLRAELEIATPTLFHKVSSELIAIGLWHRDLAQCVWVTGYGQITEASDPRAAERQRNYRERLRQERENRLAEEVALARNVMPNSGVTLPVTLPVTLSTKNKGQKRNSVSPDGDTPKNDGDATLVAEQPRKRRVVECHCDTTPILRESDSPEDVATLFLASFANLKDPTKGDRIRVTYLAALREMRSRRNRWAGIWAAFARTHADGEHAPIRSMGPVYANLRAGAEQNGERRRGDTPPTLPRSERR